MGVDVVEVTPLHPDIKLNATQQLTATPRNAAGDALTGRTVTWSSGNVAVATVSATGLLTGVGSGFATITATVDGKAGTARVAVAVVTQSVGVGPDFTSVIVGGSQQLVGAALSAAGDTLYGRPLVWASLIPAIATVSATGVVTGVSAGSAIITAAAENLREGKTTVTVLTPVATVTVTPASPTIVAGASQDFVIVLRNAAGGPAEPRPVTVTSSNPAVATVAKSGIGATSSNGANVTGVAAGTATLTVSVEGKSGTAAIVVLPPPPIAPTVVTGFSTSCGLTAIGQVYCWGGNVGDGTTEVRKSPVAIGGALRFRAISSGSAVCAITTMGAGYCWGNGSSGQIGDGGKVDRLSPTAVANGLNYKQISVGASHACGLTTAGGTYCWGYESNGELGDGQLTGYQLTPVAVVGGLTFTQLGIGNFFSCALTADGTLYYWGTRITTPTVVPGAPKFASLTSSGVQGSYPAALTAAGAAYIIDFSNSGAPAVVAFAPGQTFKSIASGYSGTSGVTTDGLVISSGNNDFGQLGNGTTTAVVGLVTATTTQKFASISAGWKRVIALTPSGEAWGWGNNALGSLGDGTTTSKSVPTAPPVPSYSLSVPAATNVGQGSTADVGITITRNSGGFTLAGVLPFSASVGLAISGNPGGVTSTFAPADITATTSTLTLAATASAPKTTATATVTATSTGLPNQTAPLAITVTDPPLPAGSALTCTSDATPPTFPVGYQCVSQSGRYVAVKYLEIPVTNTMWVDESGGLCINWGLPGKPNLATGRYKNGGIGGAPPSTTAEGKWGALTSTVGPLSNPNQFYVFTSVLDPQSALAAYSNGVVVAGGNFTKATSCPW